ncbi:hypothetical protein GYMLUDRAFT_237060 [Collybiopsis luxurians FD-317 M1]|nr:hypothetical protein GYMLUDRAFT_237060 [Collybiopsis luxurians FD-317 M1]
MNRTLIFHYKPGQLTQDVNVVLTFQPPTPSELSQDQNLIAWKVASLKAVPGSTMQNQFSVTYVARLGFSVAQLLDGNLVLPGSMIEMKLGQITQLKLDGQNLTWVEPTESSGTIIRATNATDARQNIAVGTIQDVAGGYSVLAPTFLWKVGTNISVEAEFHPVLKMYVNLGYRQNDFITANLASLKPVWQKNLAGLESIANFSFVETSQAACYEVAPLGSLLQMFKAIEPQGLELPPINIKVKFHLNWQATVGVAAISAAFVAIAKICTDAEANYTEVKNDSNFYRTIGVSKNGLSANELHKILLDATTQAIKKGDEVQSFSEDEIDLHWSISDEVATNDSTNEELEGKEDVIVKGSAAWYYLK